MKEGYGQYNTVEHDEHDVLVCVQVKTTVCLHATSSSVGYRVGSSSFGTSNY